MNCLDMQDIPMQLVTDAERTTRDQADKMVTKPPNMTLITEEL